MALNEKIIWDFFKSKGLNDYGCAGILGNLFAESGLKPNNLQDTGNRTLGMTDDEYVAAVDNGSYTKDQFVYDQQGAFLAQWTYWARKKAFYEFAKAKNVSVGNLNMQLEFIYKELIENYPAVLATLKNAKSVRDASNVVLLKYECPADQSVLVQDKRTSYSQKYYDKYAKSGGKAVNEFKMRTTKPEAGNKYYITKSMGGWSDAIQGNPVDPDCNVLSNCVGYAYGRFNEIGGWGYCKYLRPVNAEMFMQHKGDLETGMMPRVGACMVWQRGATLNGGDGAGHVAIVEKVINGNEIITSESGWGSSAFWTQTRKIGNGNWGQNSSYKFLGFIYNPAECCQAGSVVTTMKPVVQGNPTDKIYVVKRGDMLSKIAMDYGMTYQELAAYNGIADPNLIDVGQQIRIPNTASKVEVWEPKIGDVVMYNGNKHYVNANAAVGKYCKGGKATITAIYQLGKSKHPYHLVNTGSGATVHGWVDAGSFTKA
jgi:LysM repeat protein